MLYTEDSLATRKKMFTGIIEHLGTIKSLEIHEHGGRVAIHAPTFASALAVSNSIAVNGCCLTIVSANKGIFSADLSAETIHKTSFGAVAGGLHPGAQVNLEQPLTAGKEFGGHFVMGHVDGIGHVSHLSAEGENWWLGVQVPKEVARYIVPKGSITIDGISLTVAWYFCFPVLTIQVAVIPYTYAHTNLRNLKVGDAVNLEGDVLGKYVERYLEARKETADASKPELTLEQLMAQGF
jgi:riboflavin synthase